MISLGTDLGMGQPMEHVMRQSVIALRLAERLGLDEATRAVVYYAGLLGWVGCHVDAYEQAKWFGDDQALKADYRRVDMTGAAARAFAVRHVGAGRGLAERARLGVRFAAEGRHVAAHDDRDPLGGDERAGRRARARRGGARGRLPDVRALGRQGRAGGGRGRADPACRRAW